MKRKITAALAATVFGLSLCGGIIACDSSGKNGDEHVHEWSEGLKYDDKYHWHICTFPGCSEIDGKEKHDFTGGDCYCGMTSSEKPEPDDHKCVFVWDSDENLHWQYCTVDGCGKIIDRSPHVEYGECVCGRYIDGGGQPPEHEHSWTEWSWDAGWHWHECDVCGDLDAVEPHDFTNGDCKCGYKAPSRGTEGLEYELLGNNYVFCGRGTATATEIEIADEIDGIPVTSMSSSVLENCDDIKSVRLGRNIVSVASRAFNGCKELTELYLPQSVRYIESDSFSRCDMLVIYCEAEKDNEPQFATDLKKAGLPVVWNCNKNKRDENGYEYFVADGLRYGEKGGFAKVMPQSKSIREANIPSTVVYDTRELEVNEISDNAFRSCSQLSSVTLPSGLKRIGSNAFGSCNALTTVSIPSSVTEIGDTPFSGSNLEYTVRDNIKYLGNEDEPCMLLVKATDKNIVSCNIAPSAKFIDKEAYFGCNSLTTIEIPSSVIGINPDAFTYSLLSVESITVQDGNSVYRSDGNCLIDTVERTLLLGCKNSIIPDDGSIVKLAGSAFYNCGELTRIDIPEGVVEIGGSAFKYCRKLENVRLPESLTSIKSNAFDICLALDNVDIPRGVTEIGSYAFNQCQSLSEIIIPETVTVIGERAFNGCKAIFSLAIPSNVKKVGKEAFGMCEALETVTVCDGVTIDREAFSGCFNIKHLITPIDNVYSFIADALVTLVLTDAIEKTEVCGFGKQLSSAKYLTTLTVTSELSYIEEDAFFYCGALERICFDGTAAQWNAVDKQDRWDNGLPNNYVVEFSVAR